MFTDSCMQYEIQEHIHAYLYASSQRPLNANLISIAFIAKQSLIGKSTEEAFQAVVDATASTDLHESDLTNLYQSLFFGYKHNVRESRLQDAYEMDPTFDEGYEY